MTITRTINGEEFTFELTYAELRAAFEEEQMNCDEADVRDAFDDWYPDEEIVELYGVTKAQLESIVPDIARRFRRYMENDDSWCFARTEAIRDEVALQFDENRINISLH